jgi:hypothetical protein
MPKQSSKLLLAGVILCCVLFSCKKDNTPGSNIPNTNHVQFSLNGSTHYLSEMRAYTDTFTHSTLKETTVMGFNMADQTDVGETLTIDIYHNSPLKAGDTFEGSTVYTNTGADFNYLPSNVPGAEIGISFTGEPGSITITAATSTYIKGTFSIQLYPYVDFGVTNNANLGAPAYVITSGTFYAALPN